MRGRFTPGPWHYFERSHDGFHGPTVQSAFGLVVHMPKPEDAEGRANARLIASAPELLVALEACLREMSGLSPQTRKRARAAVTKARG